MITWRFAALLLVCLHCEAFHLPATSGVTYRTTTTSSIRWATVSTTSEGGGASESSTSSSAPRVNGSSPEETALAKKKKKLDPLFRAQAGPFAFQTKYGVLNPFGIWYGTVAILLGLPWFVALTLYQAFNFVTRGKFDKQRVIPNFLNQLWGVLLLRLTRSWPKHEGREILDKFFKEGRPAMFVANHNSWMDIPFLGTSIGWRNYKIISKKELGKVPILGKAILVGGNIMVDRTDKRSGLRALKAGIQYMKDGVHLCTFPEGTRSRTGRLIPFKHGAFKMAHKAGAPVIAMSIVNAHVAHPVWGMFPIKPSHNICKIVIHPPIESKGKTEDELVQAVRDQMITALPEDQRPKGSHKN